MSKRSWHVISNLRGGWSVRRTGAERATRSFESRDDAIAFAREAARDERTELYVHDSDGTVRQRRSYAEGPRRAAAKS